MNPTLPDHLLAALLVVGFPVYAARSYRSFVAAVRAGVPGVRLQEYVITMVLHWTLVGVTLLLWWQAARPWSSLGLAVPTGPRSVAGLVIMGLVIVLLAYQWMAIQRLDAKGFEGLAAQVEPVRELMPHTRAEYRVFQALSITAGVCEEVLYRGYLIWYLATGSGRWPAVLVAGVVFGIAHFYQGKAGVLKTGVIGVLAGVLYASTGSLLWSMVAHAAIDLQGGAIGWRVVGKRAM
ncbi:MAG: CPBP family intramembrane glutamic endopeptidase [Gemmatimonadales bacterium]